MAYRNDKQTQGSEQDEKKRPEEELVREQNSFGLPNSLMMAMPMTPPPGTPNSVMREMMEDAEEGSFSGRSAFGSLNAARRNRSMRAGAFFGGESFSFGMDSSPFGSGHELSHIIRHSAAPVLVSRSVSFNTIQRFTPESGTGTDAEGKKNTEDESKTHASTPKPKETPAPTSNPEPESEEPLKGTMGKNPDGTAAAAAAAALKEEKPRDPNEDDDLPPELRLTNKERADLAGQPAAAVVDPKKSPSGSGEGHANPVKIPDKIDEEIKEDIEEIGEGDNPPLGKDDVGHDGEGAESEERPAKPASPNPDHHDDGGEAPPPASPAAAVDPQLQADIAQLEGIIQNIQLPSANQIDTWLNRIQQMIEDLNAQGQDKTQQLQELQALQVRLPKIRLKVAGMQENISQLRAQIQQGQPAQRNKAILRIDLQTVPEIQADLQRMQQTQLPEVRTKQNVMAKIQQVMAAVSTEIADVYRVKRSHAQELQAILSNQDNKLQDLALTEHKHSEKRQKDPDKLQRMIWGQVEDGLKQLNADLEKMRQDLEKSKKKKPDEVKEELRQCMYEAERKEKELQGLRDLRTRKEDLLTRDANQETGLERQLRSIVSGVDAQGNVDASQELPPVGTVFKPRKITSREAPNIAGLVKYYRAWCKLNGRDLGERGNDTDPIRAGLDAVAARVALPHVGGGAPGAGPPAGPSPVEDEEDDESLSSTDSSEFTVSDDDITMSSDMPSRSVTPADLLENEEEVPFEHPSALNPQSVGEGADMSAADESLSSTDSSEYTVSGDDITMSGDMGSRSVTPVELPVDEEEATVTLKKKKEDEEGAVTVFAERDPSAIRRREQTMHRAPSNVIQRISLLHDYRMRRRASKGIPMPGEYHSRNSSFWRRWHTQNAGFAKNIGSFINSGTLFGVLEDSKRYGQNASSEGPWDLANSKHDYSKWLDKHFPSMNAALSIYGAAMNGVNAYRLGKETTRARRNMAAGASAADYVQGWLDTGSQVISGVGNLWKSAAHSSEFLAKTAGWSQYAKCGFAKWMEKAHKFASASKPKSVLPWLGLATGAADATTGTMQAIRGRITRSELHDAERKMKNVAPAPNAAAPVPGRKTDQQKLQEIMEHGHHIAKYNMWSGGMKAVAGGFSAAGSISSLAGAAPWAAGFQGAAAGVNAAKFIFERSYKYFARRRAVARELHIDWSAEKQDVNDMIHHFCPKMHVRDHWLREVILKAHGMDVKDRTEAFNQIKQDRAHYLMSLATQNPPGPYTEVADLVIKALGVYKVPDRQTGVSRYAAGAEALLAEKLLL